MDSWLRLPAIHLVARQATDRTYAILKVLQERPVPGFDSTVYNIVLTAYARSRQPNMAKGLLEEMMVTAKVVYNNCIKCWASATSNHLASDELKKRAVQRSEDLLQEMKTLHNIQTTLPFSPIGVSSLSRVSTSGKYYQNLVC